MFNELEALNRCRVANYAFRRTQTLFNLTVPFRVMPPFGRA